VCYQIPNTPIGAADLVSRLCSYREKEKQEEKEKKKRKSNTKRKEI
jgi:hypothetical protein